MSALVATNIGDNKLVNVEKAEALKSQNTFVPLLPSYFHHVGLITTAV